MKVTAALVGVLFWIRNIATVVANIIAGTVPNGTEALNTMSPHATQVVVGTLIATSQRRGDHLLRGPTLDSFEHGAKCWRSGTWCSKR
jgi:hypothetical protein